MRITRNEHFRLSAGLQLSPARPPAPDLAGTIVGLSCARSSHCLSQLGAHKPRGRLRYGQVGSYHIFIPLQAYAKRIGDVQLTILDLVGL